ncbi:hypothetical protein [Arsenicicoccus dermatophilus]|uniref:hypothetical protein n=1 Tax=Arsenicicoccus dermatophilus TaxID=1076331 RepID=UPI003917242D
MVRQVCATGALAVAMVLAGCTAGSVPDRAAGSTSGGTASGSTSGSAPGARPGAPSPGPSGSAAASPTTAPGPTAPGIPVDTPASPAVLARRTLFPGHRLVGFAGREGTGPLLGKLGVGGLDERMREIVGRSKPYAVGATTIPVAELIATVVKPAPGEGGRWNARVDDEIIARHLEAVRKVDGMLLLAIQPGRSDFVTETKVYEKWLAQPDVGVALDPEWRMGPGQVPMKQFGSVTGAELDDTARYLAELVATYKLPEKVMLYHQLNPRIVRDAAGLHPHPGVAQIVSVDGIGSATMKRQTWQAVLKRKPAHVRAGFKLFFTEDTEGAWKLMTPDQVLALTPAPDYVLYE